MAQVVSETRGLGYLRLDREMRLTKMFSQTPRDLRDLEAVRQSVVEDMPFAGARDLRYTFQSTKR